MKPTVKRLSLLRQAMEKNNIAAVIIPGTDPHASEYLADYWKEREWISGFNGSAGTAAITSNQAGLWTDSRYFLQAEEQLSGTGMELMKQGIPGTLEIVPWLASQLKAGDKVGVNSLLFSTNSYQALQTELSIYGIQLVSIDLVTDLWKNRPDIPQTPFFAYDVKYAGQTTQDKLNELRREMGKLHADVCILSALDDIAWLFNIRGNDVSYNPVTIAYSLVDNEKATLFIDPEKVTAEGKAYLESQQVGLAPYKDIFKAVSGIKPGKAVLVDGSKLNRALFEAIPGSCPIRNTMSPVFKLKSIKNKTEINGLRNAMRKDGIALVKFFKWLEEHVNGNELTELSISEKLREFRAANDLFFGESFNTIAGYAAHGAIVHYAATPESDAKIKAENILLIDSGAQYFDGTTDITRTIALGTPTVQQIIDFTLVLKGHISLATAIFPYGTRGSQLDILARKALWNKGLNYGHGTGHGIGFFLNVHEGPQSIRTDENPTILEPGMIISNEPGIYRANEYGIRTENLILVTPAKETEFGQFLQFETLTLCPIDLQLVDIDMLNNKEIKWLNEYHLQVYNTLSPGLNESERMWLTQKCTPVKTNTLL